MLLFGIMLIVILFYIKVKRQTKVKTIEKTKNS